MFFRFGDSFLAGLLGLFVAILVIFIEKHPQFTSLLEFISGLVVSLIAGIADTIFREQYCFKPMSVNLSGLAIMLPGLSLTL